MTAEKKNIWLELEDGSIVPHPALGETQYNFSSIQAYTKKSGLFRQHHQDNLIAVAKMYQKLMSPETTIKKLTEVKRKINKALKEQK